ncbi:three-Cys-motif partner protein TcmP [Caproicibacter fermentans]|uniref:Three-Cys-motif partner protein TcmP n=1 Tax=Caproicibacter fermentans TaxID=2576756 RepID=A0A7G8TD86_9FIRM|nr:three-Cys-motif partner protein TcmP [Caproicibacter fermentans]QNK41577.1 three-Cys-motif partner protein TcmP [Caproicibacter fermentans]
MPKDNSDFFKHKKIWSEVKDELLGCYMVPYFNKILSMGNPILYVDCFAGKGKFDDGKPGSPLTALQSLDKSIEAYHGRYPMPTVSMKFIELNHYQDLDTNIPPQHRSRCEVIGGKFEDNIKPLLQNAMSLNRTLNVFLYVDPYGVKVLNATLFDSLAVAFSTAELLINLNSFGFIREACRVMKVAFREREDEIFSDLEEYDSSVLDSIQELNDIAGGDYWQTVIDAYSTGKIDCYEAEKEFSQQYKERLRRNYTYVLDMPIRLKAGQHPKYRMVHATNHPDGCILMADNIAKRTDRLVIEIQNSGQLSIMPQTAENEMVSDDMLMERVKTLLEDTPIPTRLNKFLADFYNEYGVLCDLARLSSGRSGSVLKTLEKIGYIDVQRAPAFTDKGKPTAFWQEGKGKTLCLRKRS